MKDTVKDQYEPKWLAMGLFSFISNVRTCTEVGSVLERCFGLKATKGSILTEVITDAVSAKGDDYNEFDLAIQVITVYAVIQKERNGADAYPAIRRWIQIAKGLNKQGVYRAPYIYEITMADLESVVNR